MSNLQVANIFEFDNSPIRTLLKDGEPWFVAKDIAEVLGYEKPRNAIAAHCKGALIQGVPTNGAMGAP
jgi:prophage antirepressor-like protein